MVSRPLSLAVVALACCPAAASAQLPSATAVQDLLPTAAVTQSPAPSPGLPGLSPGTALTSFGTLLGGALGPTLKSVAAPAVVAAGRTVSLRVAVADDQAPLRGLSIDFGEPGGRFAESACRRGGGATGPGTFSVPYTFRTPGLHTIRLEVTSGGCAAAAGATQATLTLDVGPRPQRAAARSTDAADSAVARARCRRADSRASATKLSALRRATLCLLNAARRAQGLSRLRVNRALNRIAVGHSRDMVARGYFDHTEPPDRELYNRLRSIHWASSAGENLGAAGPSVTARQVAAAWLQSPGHRLNILDHAFHLVGIGVVRGAPVPQGASGVTYTTDFGGRAPR